MTSDTRATLPCNLCAGGTVSVLSRRSRSGAPLRTVACRGCGLVWSDPRPHDARRFYEDEYRLAYKRSYQPRPKHVRRAGQVALSRLRKIESWLTGTMRVLDVGCGGGEFAYLLRTMGHDVQAVEPNRGYAEYAAREYGLAITRGFIDDAPLADGGFDLITIWHVLEHTENPGAVLRKLRQALRPDGVLVVEVPNVEAVCQSPRSRFHEAHLYNFNAATLERLAAKTGLQHVSTVLSDDGGNLTAAFRPGADELPSAVCTLPGNHDRVAAIVQHHTTLSHLLTPHPYRRVVQRLARAAAERWAVRGGASGRALLDPLYARALTPAPPREPRPIWPWLAGSYLLALLLEWLLLDGALAGRGWTEAEALWSYFATQTAIVFALAWALRDRRNAPGAFAKFGGLALPLFLLPAIC